MNTPKQSGLRQPNEDPVTGVAPELELVRYWDGIAEVLQVSVKTAQRYEKEYGLPIRRKRGAKGTVVYALRSELNAWLASGAGQSAGENGRLEEAPATVRRLRWPWIAAAAAICAGALVLVVLKLLPHREAATFRMEEQRLSVFDARGSLLWSHVFDYSLDPAAYEHAGIPVGQFADLDGDGSKEFLFVAVAADEYKKSFYCFNADGSVRFSVIPGRTITRTVRFGAEDFAPPFGVHRFVLADEPGGQKSILVVSYDPTWFPSVVQKYSPAGKLLGEFWNPGRIFEVKAIDVGARRLLFVGAINNEFHAGSLAILDLDRPWGYGPATTPHYQCRNCPPGEPLAYLIFPEMEVARVLNAWPTVWRVHQDAPERISVHVLQTREPITPGGPPGLIGAAVYGFDGRLKLRSAEMVEGYRAVHSALELLGRLKHVVGPRDENELLPVLKWNGSSFEQIWPQP